MKAIPTWVRVLWAFAAANLAVGLQFQISATAGFFSDLVVIAAVILWIVIFMAGLIGFVLIPNLKK